MSGVARRCVVVFGLWRGRGLVFVWPESGNVLFAANHDWPQSLGEKTANSISHKLVGMAALIAAPFLIAQAAL